MADAFEAGYDPALVLATRTKKTPAQEKALHEALDIDSSEPWTQHVRRKEQDVIDQIVHGNESGHYYIILGAKVRARSEPDFSQLKLFRAPERAP
jgi:hypothetical protein